MKNGWVVDASVALAWVHPAQATERTDQLLEQLKSGVTVVVPVIWFHETANALLVLERRKKLKADERQEALLELMALRIKADHESVLNVFSRTSDFARTHGLTVYDAAYLELAMREQLPLASNDPPLQKAAETCGVRLL